MTVHALTTALRAGRGFAHKRDISDAMAVLQRSRPAASAVLVGDDCAAIPDGDGYLLFAMEGFVDDFVEAMPWFAGYCGVMVNVSDIYAMGGRPLAVVEKSIAHSLCFGLYVEHAERAQVGFARVVTDRATFAWLCDVFVADAHRNRGLSKWLVQCVIAHPDLQGVGRLVLATRDAHELYRRYGDFEALPNPEMWMVRKRA